MEDGARFLCSTACKEEFLGGRRLFDDVDAAPGGQAEQDDDLRLRPSRVSLLDARPRATPSIYRRANARAAPSWPGLALSGLATVLASLHLIWWAQAVAAVIVVVRAIQEARFRHQHRMVAWSTAVVAPVGVILATLAALIAIRADAGDWGLLVGAALAGGLLSLEPWLDERGIGPIARIVDGIAARLPSEATAAAIQHPEKMSLQEIGVGDEIVVHQNEVMPVDGVVTSGGGSVLLHPSSTQPIERGVDDFVWAGGRVLQGQLTVRVRHGLGERALERVERLASQTAQDESISARFRWWIAAWGWVPTLLLAGTAFMLAPDQRLSAAAAVLIAMPLVALRRAIDSPKVAAGSAGALRGILFGSTRALNVAGRASTTALLTRGTLTTGNVSVKGVYRIGEHDTASIVALAAATEAATVDHPFARAIRQHAAELGVRLPIVRRATHHPGLGVRATTTKGEPIVVGSRQFLLQEGVSVAMADAEAAKIENQGQTPIFVGVGERVQAVIALDDPLRSGAATAVQRIIDLPSEVVLISGDHRVTVEYLANHLHIPHVKAALLPEERVFEVRHLGDSGQVVAAVGRGHYDEHILAGADVAVLLGAVGSSLDDSNIAVMSQDIRDAAAALWIARATRQEARRTLATTLCAAGALTLGACLGLLPPLGAAISLIAIDAFALRAGSRLLRRVELRMPATVDLIDAGPSTC